MNRREFLTVAGAVASIEFEHPGATEDGRDRATTGSDGNVLSFARSLPDADALAEGDDHAFSVTRLVDDEAVIGDGPVADAAAYGTVFAGRVATDVAFGIEDRDAFLDRLATDGYERRGRRGGWRLFGKRSRTRHHVAAFDSSTAVIGAGPEGDAVRNDVSAAMVAVDRATDGRDAPPASSQAVLDHLGPGTHLWIDPTPDPRQTTPSVVATGDRVDIRGDTTVVRDVTLFESRRRARTSDPTALGTGGRLLRRAEGGVSVSYRGRAVVRDATVPTTVFLAGR